MSKIVYIHGFNSSPVSDKGLLISKNFDSVCPSYDFLGDANENLASIESQLHGDDFVFVGSSLGGYYALKLAKKYSSKLVLINPSINPKESLKKYGVAEEILNSYSESEMSFFGTITLLAMDDEVIPYETYLKFLKKFSEVRISKNVGHRFLDSEKIVSAIKEISDWTLFV